jgi:tetratricopeptide (TPR) repeat protein
MVDQCIDLEHALKQGLDLDKGKQTLIAEASTAAACNDQKHAEKMTADLEKRYPGDTLVQELYVPQARAWLAYKAGDGQRAITLLERVRAHDAVSLAPYMRGMAYLQLKDPRNAIAAFQQAGRAKSIAYYNSSPYALSYLGLGRAYVMAGDKVNAKKAYDVFFTEWKNADAGLAVVADARKEYAQL